MLNCTDLECILHHHHYHHHLHQLQHHLQDGHHAGVADPASEGDDVLHLLNSTDGELSGSHLDAPISESVYIVCGVLIAMVLVGLIIVLLAVTISKLRKREETNNNSLSHGGHGRPQAQHALADTTASATGAKVSFAQSHNGISAVEAAVAANNTTAASMPAAGFAALSAPVAIVANKAVVVNTSPPTSCSDSAASGLDEDDEADGVDGKSAPFELVLWSYPNPTTFSGTKDTLVRELPCEVPQDSKGLRKNLRGKWKRLVKKKPEDSGSIPPELRDQLKQIYVY